MQSKTIKLSSRSPITFANNCYITSSSFLPNQQMDCMSPLGVHLHLVLFHYRNVHVQGIYCVHDRGNRGKATPSCSHLLGYSCGHDLCGERSIRADLSKRTLSHICRIPTDRVLALSLDNPLLYVRNWRWFRNGLMTFLSPR